MRWIGVLIGCFVCKFFEGFLPRSDPPMPEAFDYSSTASLGFRFALHARMPEALIAISSVSLGYRLVLVAISSVNVRWTWIGVLICFCVQNFSKIFLSSSCVLHILSVGTLEQKLIYIVEFVFVEEALLIDSSALRFFQLLFNLHCSNSDNVPISIPFNNQSKHKYLCRVSSIFLPYLVLD